MAEEINALLFQLLREIRARIDAVASETKAEMTDLKVRMSALEDGQAMILGHLVQTRWRQERAERDITQLANRIAALETHIGLASTS